MQKLWSDRDWNDYLYWQSQDKKILKRINELLKDIERNGLMQGLGKPERLRYADAYSSRIDEKHRLVYTVDLHGNLCILSCYGHYE